ncbi:MAG: tRNA lysidine(34) synthetase TilS [Eubacteriaceae bacterium]|jgi:tRNA(Ile)-lysidine synthase|nr:tRNA lysidine(34) synthetase TilS [Eubacteriaceae bacterium]
MEQLENKILEFIQQNKIFAADEKVLIAVSGGADSLALLHFLDKYQKMLKIKLGVAHLNHCMRGETALADEKYVKDQCRDRGIPFYVRHTPVEALGKDLKISVEEAGRKARYDFFYDLMQSEKFDTLALGHHMDDQAETILMRLLRGTGIHGAAGMQPKGEDKARPFLCLRKEEIITYCEENHLQYRWDATNAELEWTRNFLRLQVFPLLEEVNPQSVRHLYEFSCIAAEYQEMLALQAQSYCDRHLKLKRNTSVLTMQGFEKLPDLLKKEIIRLTIAKIKGDLIDIGYNHISSVIELLKKPDPFVLPLVHGYWVKRRYHQLTVYPESYEREDRIFGNYQVYPGKCYYFSKEGWKFSLQILDKAAKPIHFDNAILLDYDKIKGTLKLRNRKPGDRIRLKGMRGRKKIKNLMIDKKIPVEKRDEIPLLSCGDDVLWVVGLCHNHQYSISENTQRLLAIQYKKF